jgi:hypothetical protein
MCPFYTVAAADFIEDQKRFLGGCAGHFGKTRGDAFGKIDAGGDRGCVRRPRRDTPTRSIPEYSNGGTRTWT